MIRKGKYQILQYPTLDSVNIHTVKVRKVFIDATGRRIIRYRYNWPFPIDTDVSEDDFKTWIVEEL